MSRAATAFYLGDEAATQALGARLAVHVAAGDVIALWGDLGAGKTCLARGLIAALAERAGLTPEDVPSPSFPVVMTYELGDLTLWHFDLYRIERPSELAELGFAEAVSEGVVVVEWPERAGDRLPSERLDIRLEWSGKGRRAVLEGALQSGHVGELLERS